MRGWEGGKRDEKREKIEYDIVGMIMGFSEAPADNLNVKTYIRLGEGGVHDWRGTQKGF